MHRILLTALALAGAPVLAAQGPSAGVDGLATVPPRAQGQDPADTLYRRAREALNRSNYAAAAELFSQVRARYPRSAHAGDAYYWEAFARYRRGGDAELRAARALLEEQAERHARAATRVSGDARTLAVRIQGSLAREGDAVAAMALAEAAAEAAVAPLPPTPPGTPRPAVAPRPPVAALARAGQSACRDEGDADVQATALNALMQMDAERALPILRKVLERRDEGSACLRRRAVFLVSQKGGAEAETLLLGAARNDPDADVRSQAVFWLAQVDSPRATAALDSIASTSRDAALQERALFALSQQRRPEAARALRRFAERSDVPDGLRARAVFWLSQSNDPENAAFLRTMYGRTQSAEVKDRILFSVSQTRDAEAGKFLSDVARNTSEPVAVRKKALFWLAQRPETGGAELAAAYATFSDRDMKEQVIFLLAQKDDRAAVDRLIDIVRREPDRDLRKKAIFWLGQSKDPRVPDVLASLLETP